MIEYDQRVLPFNDLIQLIEKVETELVPTAEVKALVQNQVKFNFTDTL